jgi:hypothetical protein
MDITNCNAVLLQAIEDVRSVTTNRNSDAWINSPYRWIKDIASPVNRGIACSNIVEKIIEQTSCTSQVLSIKTSTLWDTGRFKFQQVRPSQSFDTLVLFGIAPNALFFWGLTKETMIEQIKAGNIKPQHSQKKQRLDEFADTYWIDIHPQKVPAYINGGDIFSFVTWFETQGKRCLDQNNMVKF